MQPPVTVTAQPKTTHEAPSANGSTVVADYFYAITVYDYQRAWALGGKNIYRGSYSKFVSEHSASTYGDYFVVSSTNGNNVSGTLYAWQQNGSWRTFSGYYTVSGGEITDSHMTRTN
jgi:hypothetical protein